MIISSLVADRRAATLAARSNEDPSARICPIEAGEHSEGILVRAPAGVAAIMAGYGPVPNWALTVPQPELG